MSYGKVYLVGSGPGDVGLITLKGYQLISEADVILHDHLSPAELLNQAKPSAQIIPVGKFASRHTMPQEEINDLLIENCLVEQEIQVELLEECDKCMLNNAGDCTLDDENLFAAECNRLKG